MKLKKHQSLKSVFEINKNDVDFTCCELHKRYLELFKGKILRKGKNLKTPTFHQILYIIYYIIRHKCPINYDKLSEGSIGKLKIKDDKNSLTSKKMS